MPADPPDASNADAKGLATPPVPTSTLGLVVDCHPGQERIEVYDGKTKHVLTASCSDAGDPWADTFPDAGVPWASTFVCCGEDPVCEYGVISGCDGTSSFITDWCWPHPGTFQAGIDYANTQADGLVTVETWPDAGGGLVSGTFKTTSTLSGVFCVRLLP